MALKNQYLIDLLETVKKRNDRTNKNTDKTQRKIRTESDFPVRMMLKYNDYLISRSYP